MIVSARRGIAGLCQVRSGTPGVGYRFISGSLLYVSGTFRVPFPDVRRMFAGCRRMFAGRLFKIGKDLIQGSRNRGGGVGLAS